MHLQGTVGSPLTHDGALVGIANYGYSCEDASPDVYTKISYYHEWIRSTIEQNKNTRISNEDYDSNELLGY